MLISQSTQINSTEKTNIIDLKCVSKLYTTPSGSFTALDNINLTVSRGEYVAIIGKSGSGKSTLLNMITGIDRSTSGQIIVDNASLNTLNETKLAIWRGKHVGVVFQFFQLLPTLTIAENTMLPMDFCSTYPANQRRRRALGLLDQVGIADQADKFPAALSGGQQQRAAIARALANDLSILVADEPTGNLDSQTENAVHELFSNLSKAGKTLIIVTHERDAANFVERVILLSDGKIDGKAS
ncbi:ABC-type antimicrobial peptide transport system, ATPase component [hydrothermal vent metagenome]|uniref:ABC-type antimicrobial peptide transport system, ATPase component n=1 Tax=hydrothermal vent metagenome TaxID=652676 RepID=A0A3B1D875_9ZZZZ